MSNVSVGLDFGIWSNDVMGYYEGNQIVRVLPSDFRFLGQLQDVTICVLINIDS